MGKDARATEDAFEDINDFHDSNSESETEATPPEEVDTTPTSSRTRIAMADGSGNQAKKKRMVNNDVYIGDQMVATTQIMVNKISKWLVPFVLNMTCVTFFINAMAEVHELTNVDKSIYGSKIMGRVELMAAFMTLQPKFKLAWLHAMFK
ncbi:hypothetical protein Syun_012060 [Stephania yunnanensis]|uniref:PiggyBac transposable element-derived protein domain-containing protein n=1 Tax=Stephania yunnanensis TaxID=152371 RepID=A0AAP0PIN6_9MAGN